MATATALPSIQHKSRTKAAGKRVGGATTKRASSRKRTTVRASTQAKATRAKSARGRTIHQSETATRETAGALGDYAERALLIPVGAALIARDRVLESVTDTVSTYASSTKTQAQLRRFERRGATARNRLEREVRKARVRVERELRQRRRKIHSTVSDLEDRGEAIAKNANRVPELANRVQERLLNLV